MFSYALQVELQKKYDFIPRPAGLKNGTIPIPRKTPMFQTKYK
jgi:hypothetical protein